MAGVTEGVAAWLADLFASGRIVDAILVLVAAEALLVALRPGPFGPRAPLLAGLAAGAGLMLALRAALAGAPWPWIAAALAAAFAGHLAELALRRTGALRRREPIATSVHVPALAADVVGFVGLTVDPRRLPPPPAGEGGPCVSEGRVGTKSRKGGTTVQEGAVAVMRAAPGSEAGFPPCGPSSRPAALRSAPSPAEGGGRAASVL